MGANTICILCASPAVGIVCEHDVVVFVVVVDEVVVGDAFCVDVILAVVVVAEVAGDWEIGFGG